MAENFPTYDEVDPNTHIGLVGTTHIDFDAYINEVAHLSDDKTEAYFTDFLATLQIKLVSASADYAGGGAWMVSNAVDDIKGLADASATFLYLYVLQGPGPAYYISLRERYEASGYADDTTISLNTDYYLTIKKLGTALQCKTYTDATRTTLLKTTSLTLHADHSFQYIFAAVTRNNGGNGHADIDIDNLSLAGIGSTSYTKINRGFN